MSVLHDNTITGIHKYSQDFIRQGGRREEIGSSAVGEGVIEVEGISSDGEFGVGTCCCWLQGMK